MRNPFLLVGLFSLLLVFTNCGGSNDEEEVQDERFQGVGKPKTDSDKPESNDDDILNLAPIDPKPLPSKPVTQYSISTNPDDYERQGLSPAVYDLSNDDEIPLVQRINALIAQAQILMSSQSYQAAGRKLEVAIAEGAGDHASNLYQDCMHAARKQELDRISLTQGSLQ